MTSENTEPHGEPSEAGAQGEGVTSPAAASAVPEPANSGTGSALEVQRKRGRPPLRLSSPQIVLIAALAVLTPFVTWRAKSLEKALANRDSTSAVVSKPAPPFSLATLDGRTISLSDYKGKKVVISYWASWCGPCKAEMPELRDFYNEYHKANADFELLAISIDENRSDAERYTSEEKLPFPVLLDSDSRVADTYAVEGIPTLFVVDKSGRVAYAHVGLDAAMRFQLMTQLGIQFPGIDKTGDPK